MMTIKRIIMKIKRIIMKIKMIIMKISKFKNIFFNNKMMINAYSKFYRFYGRTGIFGPYWCYSGFKAHVNYMWPPRYDIYCKDHIGWNYYPNGGVGIKGYLNNMWSTQNAIDINVNGFSLRIPVCDNNVKTASENFVDYHNKGLNEFIEGFGGTFHFQNALDCFKEWDNRSVIFKELSKQHFIRFYGEGFVEGITVDQSISVDQLEPTLKVYYDDCVDELSDSLANSVLLSSSSSGEVYLTGLNNNNVLEGSTDVVVLYPVLACVGLGAGLVVYHYSNRDIDPSVFVDIPSKYSDMISNNKIIIPMSGADLKYVFQKIMSSTDTDTLDDREQQLRQLLNWVDINSSRGYSSIYNPDKLNFKLVSIDAYMRSKYEVYKSYLHFVDLLKENDSEAFNEESYRTLTNAITKAPKITNRLPEEWVHLARDPDTDSFSTDTEGTSLIRQLFDNMENASLVDKILMDINISESIDNFYSILNNNVGKLSYREFVTFVELKRGTDQLSKFTFNLSLDGGALAGRSSCGRQLYESGYLFENSYESIFRRCDLSEFLFRDISRVNENLMPVGLNFDENKLSFSKKMFNHQPITCDTGNITGNIMVGDVNINVAGGAMVDNINTGTGTLTITLEEEKGAIPSSLEQFEIYVLKLMDMLGFSTFTNFGLFLIIAFGLFFFLFKFVFYYNKIVSIKFFWYIHLLYLFILNLIEENINNKEYRFFPYLITLFVLIVLINVVGMIPYSFTNTSHISFTMFFSLITFYTATYLSIEKHKEEFFSLFLPKDTPLLITPFLIIIEIISYIARLFSLAIRLFANMMSGHTLLHILAKFAFIMCSTGGAWLIGGMLPAVIVFCVFFLESSIAVLQSYVFTILYCIYVGDGVNLH